MIPQEAELLQFHLQALVAILYRNTSSSERINSKDFEKVLQQQMLESISSKLVVSSNQIDYSVESETDR